MSGNPSDNVDSGGEMMDPVPVHLMQNHKVAKYSPANTSYSLDCTCLSIDIRLGVKIFKLHFLAAIWKLFF